MSNLPTLCNQCGERLSEPAEEIEHPEDDNPPANAHFRVQIRSDGEERLQCKDTGLLAKPIESDEDEYEEVYEEKFEEKPPTEEGSPEPTESKEEKQKSEPKTDQKELKQSGEVYDFEEEKSQIDILGQVVANPHYGLEDPQITEVISWAKDFNGQLPPDILQDLASNMKGVQKQTAKLIRRRYEIKLNNWYRKQQSQENEGPPIGVMGGPRPNQSSSSTPNPPPTSSPQPEQTNKEPKAQGESDGLENVQPRDKDERGEAGGLPNHGLRKERRQRRLRRRNDALDITAEEMAKEAAPEIARELAQNFGTYFGLPAKVLEAKAERDPDWFLEKADELEEKLGITIFDILEESQAKQEQKEQRMEHSRKDQTEVDEEMDEALQRAKRQSQQETNSDTNIDKEQTQESDTDTGKQTVNTQKTVPDSATPMERQETGQTNNDKVDGEKTNADEMYEQIFNSGD